MNCLGGQRVAIVYSETSAARYYDRFTYNQLFTAAQNQARMAGIPYDLLNEDDLTDINKVIGHQVLIIPFMPNVKVAKLAAIEAVLDTAVTTHQIGLIVGGNLMTESETGVELSNASARINRWMGVTPGEGANGVATNLVAQTISHPAMQGYTASEGMAAWPLFWFGSFSPVAGQSATVLATLKVGGTSYNGVVATQTGGRNVHFATEDVLGSTNLLWSCIQWAVYGTQAPMGLYMGRMKSLFASRVDMDQSMFVEELGANQVPLLNLLTTWKANYNFVGSYYINLGNKPADGETTDWSISGPLYQRYLALGNEIGTHSWTHPDSTGALNATQLEFEFNQSKNVISSQLGINVVGAAIPGVAESIAVQQQLDNYFGYISGRYGAFDNGFQVGVGRLTPDSKSMYWSLNMEPDFSLVEDQRKTPAQAQAVWANQMAATAKHTNLPLMHWLWHDYAPTSAVNLYTVGLISNTIATAKNAGAEFATLANLTDRIRRFENAGLTVTGTNPITASVTAQGVGQFSLRPSPNQSIASVSNWYAYDNTQVFLPDNGGTYTIQLGPTPANVSRITELPMRSRLLTATGDGTSLAFSFEGEGTVKVAMTPALAAGLVVTGATSHTVVGNQLSLVYAGGGVHSTTLTSPVNQPPVTTNATATTRQPNPVLITLTATDANNNPLTFSVVTSPANGLVAGSSPTFTYTPNAGFIGNDSFTYRANDGRAYSNVSTVSISVTAPPPPPPPPPVTLTRQITTSADDAEQSASGSVKLDSSDLEFVMDGSNNNQVLGLRFPSLAIPKGALISSATIQLQANETHSGATTLSIAAQTADNSPVFTSTANNISSRPKTINTVTWQPPAWNTVNEAAAAQRTPNLATVVQEIVSRSGWASGNAIAFIVYGVGQRTADSFDTGDGTAPVLTITYSSASYTDWLTAYATLSGNAALRTANPDGDALNNLLEYALASNPLYATALPYALTKNGGGLAFTYSRPSLATDLTYAVEWSPNPSAGNWTSTGITEQIVSDDGAIRTVRASTQAGGRTLFMRLKVTTP